MKRPNQRLRILGIQSTLKTPVARRALRIVLGQIRAKSPRDFFRLQDLVLSVRPRKWNDGTQGEFVKAKLRADDMGTLDRDSPRPGTVFVTEDKGEPEMIGLLAHELGHACTTREDLDRRCAPDGEWASELSADWYAYKWGFGRFISRARRTRQWSHHGPTPGMWIEDVCPDPKNPSRVMMARYKVSRRFRVVEVGKPRRLTRSELAR